MLTCRGLTTRTCLHFTTRFHTLFDLVKTWRLPYPQCNQTLWFGCAVLIMANVVLSLDTDVCSMHFFITFVFKLVVLKRLWPEMRTLRTWLGLECDSSHLWTCHDITRPLHERYFVCVQKLHKGQPKQIAVTKYMCWKQHYIWQRAPTKGLWLSLNCQNKEYKSTTCAML